MTRHPILFALAPAICAVASFSSFALAADHAAMAPAAADPTGAAPATKPVVIAPLSAETRFNTCVSLVDGNPVAAQKEAENWRDSAGGGIPARHCLGLALMAQDRYDAASVAFEQAAKSALLDRDGRAAGLLVQAGNAALAGDDPARARLLLDNALALPSLSAPQRGEALLDHARARVGLGELPGARADLDAALKLVAGDPMAWLLSATLARRMNDLGRAENDIGEAIKRAPDDAAVAYEAGNIAWQSGAPKAAEAAWRQAADADAKGPTGDNARRSIAQLIEAAKPANPPAVPAR